ncbi:MAG: hypothetical protein ACI3ZD_00100 [Prevotella sp.]
MLIENLYQLDYMGVSSWKSPNEAGKNKQHQVNARIIIPEKYEADIKALCEYSRITTLKEGMTINITLQEILKICPRKRHRIDSYSTLVRYLREQLGVELVITSNKTKNNGKENL